MGLFGKGWPPKGLEPLLDSGESRIFGLSRVFVLSGLSKPISTDLVATDRGVYFDAHLAERSWTQLLWPQMEYVQIKSESSGKANVVVSSGHEVEWLSVKRGSSHVKNHGPSYFPIDQFECAEAVGSKIRAAAASHGVEVR